MTLFITMFGLKIGTAGAASAKTASVVHHVKGSDNYQEYIIRQSRHIKPPKARFKHTQTQPRTSAMLEVY